MLPQTDILGWRPPAVHPTDLGFLEPTAVRGVILVMSTLLVAFGVYVLIGLRRNRMLIRLRREAERFAAGDLAQKISVEGPSDVARLAEALNRMAGQLDERLRHLASQRNELMAVLASMVEGVLAVDLEERVISLNPSAVALLDVDPVTSIGRPIVEVVRNAALQDFVRATLASDQPMQAGIVLRGGEATGEAGGLHLLAQGAALREASGQRIGGLIVLQNVTQLRRLEAVRRDFVANVSHEVKTPVSAIKAAAETLLGMGLEENPDAERFLRIITRQADRLHALVEDLLNLARIEQDAEKQRITLRPGRVAEVVAGAVEACQLKADAKGVRIETACPDDLWANINPGLLEQALLNLLDNAVKYSPDMGMVKLDVEAHSDEVLLMVSDQGCGIEPEHLARIFERFYRVDRARSRALGGTGLGLAIVKHVAQAHGGRVSVESSPGRGSTFRLHLPIHATPATLAS